MALTDAQLSDARRFLGYQALGTTMAANENQDLVYVRFGMVTMSLYERLTTLSASEESTLISVYLNQISTLETAILGTSDNLDTDQAAVWVHNKNEQRDRDRLFESWRRRMCGFLGVDPGPGLGNGNVRIIRG